MLIRVPVQNFNEYPGSFKKKLTEEFKSRFIRTHGTESHKKAIMIDTVKCLCQIKQVRPEQWLLSQLIISEVIMIND